MSSINYMEQSVNCTVMRDSFLVVKVPMLLYIKDILYKQQTIKNIEVDSKTVFAQPVS